jgi:hypothetical protein
MTQMDPERWENGSEYNYPRFAPAATPPSMPFSDRGRLYGTGRDALRALLRFGKERLAWKRFWCPSFFCQEVLTSLSDTGVEAVRYPDDPTRSQPALELVPAVPGDALLIVNYFGLRGRPEPESYPGGVTVVEDHTHDPLSPWAWGSRAHYCVASLRKTLPVPDGAALWSPTGEPLPAPHSVTDVRATASGRKLAAMLMKTLYLVGAPVEKAKFRAEAMSGERAIASGEVSGITQWSEQLLRTFPVSEWWDARRRNHRILTESLTRLPGIEILQPSDGGSCPLSVYLVFDSPERREMIRQGLCSASVYPAVLWSLEEALAEGISEHDVDLSRRVLSIHCDFRYGEEDMRRTGEVMKSLMEIG